MGVLGFHVRNYKSIVDTGWRDFSSDGVTALIGENESGKSALLEALLAFDTGELSVDGLRDDNPPMVACSFQVDDSLWEHLESEKVRLPDGFVDSVLADRCRVNLLSVWDPGDLNRELTLEQSCLTNLFLSSEERGGSEDDPDDIPIATPEEVAVAIWRWSPKFIWFRDDSSILPDEMNISAILNSDTNASGYDGVMNFLQVADARIDAVKRLMSRSPAKQFDATESWSTTVTANFHEFWSQEIGAGDKVEVECRFVPVADGPRSPGYLAFLLKDATGRGPFGQRSQGFRWFLSFYLQLKARATSPYPVLYLLDEPGSSLHGRAQDNVLGVFSSLPEAVEVVYSTHSPWLVDPTRTPRVLAIQRRKSGKRDTQVIDALKLASASKDTLFPLLHAMGADLRSNCVVQQRDNVLLEEPSAAYYWRAFLHLVGEGERKAHFIGDHGGADKVPGLVSMFEAWGLGFVTVLDGDTKGESVKKTLVEQYLGEDDRIMLLDGCAGIEDVFSQEDYLIHVIEDPAAKISGRNSSHAKRTPKAVLAKRFLSKVEEGTISMKNLTLETQDRVSKFAARLTDLLDGSPSAPTGNEV